MLYVTCSTVSIYMTSVSHRVLIQCTCSVTLLEINDCAYYNNDYSDSSLIIDFVTMKLILGHSKRDFSFPSTARTSRKGPPVLCIIALLIVLFTHKNAPRTTWHKIPTRSSCVAMFQVSLGLLFVANAMVLINISVYDTENCQTLLPWTILQSDGDRLTVARSNE